MSFRSLLTVFFLCISLGACAPMQQGILDSDQSQLQLRRIQSRMYDTNDREKTLRTVIATLQDLDFVIDKADLGLGTVSATKLDGYVLRMTVSVYPRGNARLVVRANAQLETSPISDPLPYQNFFAALSRAMFLRDQQVD